MTITSVGGGGSGGTLIVKTGGTNWVFDKLRLNGDSVKNPDTYSFVGINETGGSGSTYRDIIGNRLHNGILITSGATSTRILGNNRWSTVTIPISNADATSYPAISVCGTNPTLTAGSTNYKGTVTVGSGGPTTACTVTFGTAFTNTPSCEITSSFLDGGHYFSAKTNAVFTVTFANNATSSSFDYSCIGLNE